MTVLIEGRHPGEFLMTEANGQRSRENITIASGGGIIAPGTVLGKITATGKYLASAVGATDGSGGPLEVDLSGLPGVDTSRMLAASLNITVVNSRTSSAGGYVTVYPCRVRPNASNVNFVTGLTIANGVIAPVSRFGKVCIYVYGEADLLVDVNGVVSY